MKWLFLIVALAVLCHAKTKVSMLVFSGTENPSWTITDQQEKELEYILDHEPRSVVSSRVMGYQGFVVSNRHIYGFLKAESFLLSTAPMNEMLPRVLEHVHDVMSEYVAPRNRLESESRRFLINFDCNKTPIRGPNTPPKYDPNSDCGGCFVAKQSYNNCYNYGNDVVTNTFAQPGRGTGHKWERNTCDDVRRAATSDGLKWVGSDLPKVQPPEGHYVALLIWPNTNFHWIRMDDNMYWSHKPGQTPVKNTDNRGSRIKDPSKQDFSPWSQFCGYMLTLPSNVTIN
jgi:hypothetical protein